MEVTVIRGVWHWTRSFVVLVPLVLACAGTQPKEGEVPAGDGSGETSGDDTGSSKPSKYTPPPESGGLNDTQKEQMMVVLKRGARTAENCTATVTDGKGGEGDIKVLFDGQKGKISDVTVGMPWAGTPMEVCIKQSFTVEYIVPFDGDPLEVPYTIKIPEKAGPAVDPKKPGKKK
jgi:hypothetical protein